MYFCNLNMIKMPSKDEVLASIKNEAYSGASVKHLINSIAVIEVQAPSNLKRGDVYRQECGVKRRPVVIIKVLKDIVVGIPLSTTCDCLNLSESKSRFFKTGFFANQLVTAPINYANDNFLGVYDNPKILNVACKKMKEFYSNIL